MDFNVFELNHIQQNHSPDGLAFLFSPSPFAWYRKKEIFNCQLLTHSPLFEIFIVNYSVTIIFQTISSSFFINRYKVYMKTCGACVWYYLECVLVRVPKSCLACVSYSNSFLIQQN